MSRLCEATRYDGPPGHASDAWRLRVVGRANDRFYRERSLAKLLGVRACALVELGDPEAIDLFLCEEDAMAALEDALRDEPGWAGTLAIEPIELDEPSMSPN
jgi:hypothetical protein